MPMTHSSAASGSRLVESGGHHQHDRGLGRAAAATKREQPRERDRHQRRRRQMRIVDADITVEEPREHDDEPQSAQGGGNRFPAEFTDRDRGRGGGRDDRHERKRAPDRRRIRAQLGQRADEIKRERGIIVGDQRVVARIIDADLERECRAPDRANAINCRDHRQNGKRRGESGPLVDPAPTAVDHR
jgi:hypothetical protein